MQLTLETLYMNWESQCAKRELPDALRRTRCGFTKCKVIEMAISFHTVSGAIRIKMKHVFGMIATY